jgi:hypothetical protein
MDLCPACADFIYLICLILCSRPRQSQKNPQSYNALCNSSADILLLTVAESSRLDMKVLNSYHRYDLQTQKLASLTGLGKLYLKGNVERDGADTPVLCHVKPVRPPVLP